MKSNVSKKSKFERSAEIINTQTNTSAATMDDLPNASLSSHEAITMKDISNGPARSNSSLASYGIIEIPQNASNRTMFNGRMLTLVRHISISCFSLIYYEL